MKSSCPFPARELLAFRSSIIAEVIRFEESGAPEWPVRAYAEQLLLIEQLRLAHAELTHCRCWSTRSAEGA
jgi:hypothetical protein